MITLTFFVKYLIFSYLVQGIELFHSFRQQRDPFFSPYCLKMVLCLIIIITPSFSSFSLNWAHRQI
ncbi:unnamed protein product, partial [Staurois parvus]